MVGTIDLITAKKIFGKNFIGPDELVKISQAMNLPDNLKGNNMAKIPFDVDYLKNIGKDYILILGLSKDKNGKKLTLNNMKDYFVMDSSIKEPSFYNQDWYLKEDFASKKTLENRWYLIKKKVIDKTRGKRPDEIEKALDTTQKFPLAILTAYTFFANYFLNNGEILWKNDFIWCSDQDHNGDIIYTGRYEDPIGINKKGFNIHRHLAIRPVYGLAPEIQ